MFAHVDDLDSFMDGVTTLLSDDGIFISESGYVVDMIEGMQYDSIYHEHLRYYGVKPLVALFLRFGMEIIDIERITTHGGSIRVSAAKKGARGKTDSVTQFLAKEETSGYHSLPAYSAFAEKIVATKHKLLRLIFDLKEKGEHIVGVGAPAKGNTLLNYCKIDTDMIDYLTEKSALKIGLYSPGMHIPVIDEKRMFEDSPEAALLLSWNIADELKKKLREKGYKGKFITPNPTPKILDD